MAENIKLYHGDCLEVMKDIPDKSVDMILCDLPCGTTKCKWDTIIPFVPLWEQYNRIIKDNGAIVLFASQPFTSVLVNSNIRMFKYEWIWRKNKGGNPLNVKKIPMKQHESILVFYKKSPTYNPQSVQFCKVERGLHPTQKPVALLEYLVKTYTNEGELILDNCMGSGSTGVACVNINRKFIGIELNEEYFNLAKGRIESVHIQER